LSNRIIIGIPHYYGDRARRLHNSTGRGYAYRNNAVHFETGQVGGEVGKSVELPFGKLPLNDEVLSFDISKIAEVSSEYFFTGPNPGRIR
jgi:hypothetical protein